MRRVLTVLFLSAVLLTACGSAEEPVVPTSTAVPPTQIPTIEATMTPEQPFEIKLSEDSMNSPYGVAVNSLGNIYVSDTGKDRVLIFDVDGNLLAKWDKKGSGDGEFKTLGFGGLAIDSADNVFVVDNENHRVQKFDKDGNYILQWGSEGTEDGQFVRAIGIAVDADGNVYVTDDGNPFVQKFDNDGNFLMKFGGDGSGGGKFKHATGIAVDLQGNIFVADYESKYVQKFDATGTFITAWKMGADIGFVGTPEGIAVDADGNVYVTDYDLGRMQVFDNNGEFLWGLGGKKTTDNPFKRPTAIAFGNGVIYVVNQSGAKVSVVEFP
ncbi:MAG: hypothetical protein RIR73_1931 [Chloroflexota bacterium]